MPIFHICVKPIQRSKGQSATAGAAYRTGEKIKDERTGEIHNYIKKQGITYTEIVAPRGLKIHNSSRSNLWNMAEQAEKRKDGTTAKEYEISLPAELSDVDRKKLALEFTNYLVNRHQCVADVALHQPSRNGDQRNYHAHILCTTRKYEYGKLTNKCDVELSDRDRKKKGLGGRREELEHARKTWEKMVNNALRLANIQERVSSLSLVAQGIDREPTQHMGKSATAIERKGQTPRRTRIKDKIITSKKEELEVIQASPSVLLEQIEKNKKELDELVEIACMGKIQKVKDDWKNPYLQLLEENKPFIEKARRNATPKGQLELKNIDNELFSALKTTGWSINKKYSITKPLLNEIIKSDDREKAVENAKEIIKKSLTNQLSR